MAEPQVYLVAYLDGAWDGYDPLSSTLDFPVCSADPTDIGDNLRVALDLMADCVGGRFVFAAHTGVYCRELFYQEPMLSLYGRLLAQGGELAVHPHEELVGESTFVNSERHMRAIILEKAAQLTNAGIGATAYRGGYSAFAPRLTSVLEEAGISVELSATPGRENRRWGALWKDASPTAYYLCSQDAFHTSCDHAPSTVLEIPLGWDGEGTDLDSYLWNESADLESMKRTWEKILARQESTGETQFVHTVAHLFSMDKPEFRERWAAFLTYAQDNGARVVTPSQARDEFNRALEPSGLNANVRT